MQILFNYPPKGEVNSSGYIYRDAKRRAIYLALFTHPERDSCFSIYQISWIKMKKITFCKLKTSLSRNFLYNIQYKSLFTINTDKPRFVPFLVFLCTIASFITKIPSSENVLKRDAILVPVAKQWIAKDSPCYGSQSKCAKIAIHWFGKY